MNYNLNGLYTGINIYPTTKYYCVGGGGGCVDHCSLTNVNTSTHYLPMIFIVLRQEMSFFHFPEIEGSEFFRGDNCSIGGV